MKKYVILSAVLVLTALLCSGCKALAEDNNGEEEINVAGTWIFSNLSDDTGETHTRSFTLTGTKTSGTVTDNMATATGTYTVTNETEFVMNLTDFDASFAWDFDYEGTIVDNRNMTGNMKTTTYNPERTNVVATFDFTYTAKRDYK